MTTIKSHVALMSLLMLPFVAAAQDDENTDDFESPLDQTVPVAGEPTEAPLEPAKETVTDDASSDEASEEKLLDEFARYRRLISAGTLDEADVAAKRIVEMAIRVYGPQSRETASALNNLGIVQHRNQQFDAAIQNFTAAVEIIEFAEDRLNGALVNPLKGLGAAQLAIGRPAQARKTYDRAAHITHVNDGPHNIGQVEILESLVEAYIRLGEAKMAREILDRIHIISVKFYQDDPMGLLPSLMSRAAWQHRAGYYADERATYRRAIRIIESVEGKESTKLISPLKRLGRSFYFIDLSMTTLQQQGTVSTGEMYFKRAARIAAKAENLDWRVAADARIALADYYNFVESVIRARKIYKEIWEFLSADEDRIEYRDELFGDPVPIRGEALPTFAGRGPANEVKPDEVLTGKITVTYNLSEKGRVQELKTEADPIEFTTMQRVVHREIRRRAFRPRFVEGLPTAAPDQVFEHEFMYTQADLEALKREQAAASK